MVVVVVVVDGSVAFPPSPDSYELNPAHRERVCVRALWESYPARVEVANQY